MANSSSVPKGVSPRLAAFLSGRRYPRHALSSFLVMPQNLRFETQGDREQIVLFLRRHPISNVPWIIMSILMLLAPVILFPLFSSIEPISAIIAFSPSLPLILGAFWYLVIFGFILSNFFVWYFTVNIATNERVVDIDFFFLLYKEFSEALLSRVEDVTFTMGGFIRAIFDYGDVFITTAATTERLEFDRVPLPQEAVRIITELVQEAGK